MKSLTISNIRNLTDYTCEFSPGMNFILGPNGSGKSSILEAIHYLSLGRSFRTRQINKVISYGAEYLRVVAMAHDGCVIGIEKNNQGQSIYKLDGETLPSLVHLARHLPLQLIAPHSYQIIAGSPKGRRQFLDWAVFHVEHDFMAYWQACQKALKQRNAALREKLPKEQVISWDHEIIKAASQINQYRKNIFCDFKAVVNQVLAQLHGPRVELTYYPGWRRDASLSEILEQGLSRDQELGYTQFGPHRADLKMTVNGVAALDVLSRGQQKTLVCALHLAQGLYLRQSRDITCLYLLDDLNAELDQLNSRQVIDLLREMGGQIIITAVDDHIINIYDPNKASTIQFS